MPKDHVFVSFVHGFHERSQPPAPNTPVPALWELQPDGQQANYTYQFPQDGTDFATLPYPFVGEPAKPQQKLEKAHRFGFSGLRYWQGDLYAASWNGIYRIDATTKAVKAFISNRFTAYLHKIAVTADAIYIAMPFTDSIAIVGHDGTLMDAFRIDRRLQVTDDRNQPIDWRFQTKPWSGSSGYFHFNNVQKIDDKLYITTRNLSAFIVVDLNNYDCYLRPINHKTTVCLHDGDYYQGSYYFTSIDGKIIVATEPEQPDDTSAFHYDLRLETIERLGDTPNNWCRGIAVTDDRIYVTIDGRYGSDLSFGLLELDRQYNLITQERFHWSAIGPVDQIRYVTGFDLQVLPT